MKHLILFFFAAAVLAGCTKQSNPVTNFIYTHSDSALVGTMVGHVNLFDSKQYYYDPPSGHAGVIVSIEGTPFKATSDSSGKWEIKLLPAGTYTVDFTKGGYTLAKLEFYKFVGNGTDYVGSADLYQIPTLHPQITIGSFKDFYRVFYRDSLYTYPNGDTTTLAYVPDSVFLPAEVAQFTCSTTEYPIFGSTYIEMCFYLGKTDHIDPLDPNSYILQTPVTEPNRSSNPKDPYATKDLYDVSFYRDSLQMLGFKSGDKVYCMAVAGSWASRNTYYFDLGTYKNVYTGFSPIHSEVKNFILP
jgi:hypothetical protein